MNTPNPLGADRKDTRRSLKILGACVVITTFFSSVATVSGSFGYTMADIVKLLRPTLPDSGNIQPDPEPNRIVLNQDDLIPSKPALPPDTQPVSLPVPLVGTVARPIPIPTIPAPVPGPSVLPVVKYQFGDQVLNAVFDNGGITLTYSVVSSLMTRHGVKEGSFYGHLKIDGTRVSGSVYGSTKKCGRVAVQVEGTMAEDMSHIEFTGSGAYLDAETCEPVKKRFVQASLERI